MIGLCADMDLFLGEGEQQVYHHESVASYGSPTQKNSVRIASSARKVRSQYPFPGDGTACIIPISGRRIPTVLRHPTCSRMFSKLLFSMGDGLTVLSKRITHTDARYNQFPWQAVIASPG